MAGEPSNVACASRNTPQELGRLEYNMMQVMKIPDLDLISLINPVVYPKLVKKEKPSTHLRDLSRSNSIKSICDGIPSILNYTCRIRWEDQMEQTISSGHFTVNLHYKKQVPQALPRHYEHSTVSFMGLAGRLVSKALKSLQEDRMRLAHSFLRL